MTYTTSAALIVGSLTSTIFFPSQSSPIPTSMANAPQAPAGGFSKRHVSGMMKHLADDEQRNRALEVAAEYKKKFAEEPQWAAVRARLQTFAEEDPLRVVSKRRPTPLKQLRRPTLTNSSSAPPVVSYDGQSPISAPPPRLSTATSLLSSGRACAPSTPRERWDVLNRGPATPLTPTPAGNAFAGGGFWEQLTPKTPVAPHTPITAIPRSPFSPIVPKDVEARAAYDNIKKEVDTMSRTICANRLSGLERVRNSEDVPKTLIRSSDHHKAAELTLQYRKNDLSSIIQPDLPQQLKTFAAEETCIIHDHSIRDTLELLDIDGWLSIEEPSLVFTTLLDAQSGLMRMHCHRRKNSILNLPDRAVQEAWAVRILEDAERRMDDSDGSSTHSDEEADKGYEYNNFLRSLKREDSEQGPGGLTDLTRLRSNASMAESLKQLSREQTLASQRSSRSPKKSVRSGLSMASSKHDSSPSPEKPSHPRHTETPSPDEPSQWKPAAIITTFKEADDRDRISTPELSTEARACRRMGASHVELSGWAEQLKMMEERRDAMRGGASTTGSGSGSGSSHSLHHRHPALRSAEKLKERDFSNHSFKCQTATEYESVTDSQRSSHNPNDTNPTATLYPPRTSSMKPLPATPASPNGFKYASPSRNENTASLHVSVRRKQHARSKSSLARASVGEEDEWAMELRRMEGRERVRQMRGVSEDRNGRGSMGRRSGESSGGDREEWGIGVAR